MMSWLSNASQTELCLHLFAGADVEIYVLAAGAFG
jgi:hypothetical protein